VKYQRRIKEILNEGNQMKLSRKGHSVFALILVSGLFIAPINMYSAHGSASKVSPSKTAIFVGGDIHTLTYTADGLFVTGHQAGNVSTDGGVSWKVISSFNNADIMGWATTSSGYLAGGHTGMYRTTNRGKTFSRGPERYLLDTFS
jgi:hypothetical protein